MRGVIGVHAAIKHRAFAHRAGGQLHRQCVAETNAVNVALLHIGAHPKIILVDERDDRLAGIHDFAFQGRAGVNDPVDRRFDFGVTQLHGRLFLLRPGGLSLFVQGFDARFRGGVSGSRLVVRLCRFGALLV